MPLFNFRRKQSTATRKDKSSKSKGKKQNYQESLGGVFTTAQHVKSLTSIHSEETDNTLHSTGSSIASTESTWSSSGSPSHHQGAPLVVPRSPSVSGRSGRSAMAMSRTTSLRNIDEPATLGRVMAKARTLPHDSDYISSNHVMVNAERINKLVQPLVRMPALDDIARSQAKAMAERGELFHSDPKGLVDQIHRPSNRLGENVARGDNTRVMHTAMMKNVADRNNMIDRRFTSFGVGTAKAADGTLYLCQVYRG